MSVLIVFSEPRMPLTTLSFGLSTSYLSEFGPNEWLEWVPQIAKLRGIRPHVDLTEKFKCGESK